MAFWAEESGCSPVIPVRANEKDTMALLESGSMVTLIRQDFAKTTILVDTVAITGIHGETKNFPTTLLQLQTTKGQCTGPVGPNLPVLVLIGRDSPMFRQLWASMSGDRGRGSPNVGGCQRSTRAVRRRETPTCGL